ncbi:DNA/RNA helicase of DEAD/DEAH box family [Lachnospiraceae bacterium TWA4]|nr:DNA/RNA helicase of DEAD/DEAH box family [Lachnospiraceae bacterium TWA4]
MQVQFITNLKKIIESGEKRALLLSATGTGKTYASAFAMRELGFKKILFVVHRAQLAEQAMKSYSAVFDDSVSMGMVGAGKHEYDKDIVFAMVETLNRDQHLFQYNSNTFDCIILDEAHHSPANTYQKIMNYFTPKFFLGMTATPDKRDDHIEGRNVYELFNYQIAHEIRLQKAMEDHLLCPFHYFGISDISVIDESQTNKKLSPEIRFNYLTSDERVKHIIEQANYYGYSGERVKGVIFCSGIRESEVLSEKLNQKGFRTIALNGSASNEERTNAFERLAMSESEATNENQPLDYILSYDILNEGVDIVEINQVIMLRPTQSPIVFIQQLGRGLRKVEGKEFVVVLDFIGNYKNNFMIPIALSGDRTYNADTIRKYVISGNNIIPGESTVHFDRIAKEKIFESIDRIRGMRTIIKDSYTSLKNRLGKIPYLLDFYENGEIDPLVIIKEYKTYYNFLKSVEKAEFKEEFTPQEELIVEYLSKTVLSGSRPYELEILKRFLSLQKVTVETFQSEFKQTYGYEMDMDSFENAVDVLQGKFVTKEDEYKKYCHMDIVGQNNSNQLERLNSYTQRLKHPEFYKHVRDIIEVGLRRYQEKYLVKRQEETPFILYEKYSRRDVSLLMNCGKDLSSTMYGMKRIGDDVFIFVTYHKVESNEDKNYVEGKPDYADAFEDNLIFRWDSQIGRGINSSYVADVVEAKRKHLFVKKSDAETNFYYMGQFDIMDIQAASKKDNNGKDRELTKLKMKMKQPVRDDLLQYLQSSIEKIKQIA